jgi:hypothetical protein
MNGKVTEFFSPIGPTASATPSASMIFNIALAAATSTATDLTGANFAGLLSALQAGDVVTFTATVDIWYRWAAATGTVDETKTAADTPANQGILLPAGIRVPERWPLGLGATPFLICKATPLAGTLCIQISSRPENQFMKFV